MKADKRQQFTSAMETYEPKLKRLCTVKLNGSPYDPEDIISEVFLLLWLKIDSDGMPENVLCWLYGTANNIIKMKYRKDYTKGTVLSLDDTTYELAYSPDFTADIETAVILDDLLDELNNKLTDDEKALMEAVHRQDKSLFEVAEQFGVSYSAIKQKHYRTVNKIKKIAKKYFL